MNKRYSQYTQTLYGSSAVIDIRWFYGTMAFLFGLIGSATDSRSEYMPVFTLFSPKEGAPAYESNA